MKHIYLFILWTSCVTNVVIAQLPQRFSYQAVIRNTSNALLVNQPVGLRISILQGSATGTAVYVETHSATTTVNGQVTVEIGGGTVVSGAMSGINWSIGSYFVKTETDPVGGTNYSLVSTSRLQSVPYAMYAATSSNGVGNGTLSNQMMYWNGSAWVTLNPGTNGQVLTLCNGALTWTTGGQCPVSVPPCPPSNNLNTSVTYGSMTDQEGNVYKTVTLGTQVWMAENIKTGRYRNGDPIPNVTNDSSWSVLTTGAFSWYNHDSLTNHCRFGRLYNWYTCVDSRNLCPTGWHIPSEADWRTLIQFLGGDSLAGTKMKASAGWSSNGNGTNTSGFSAVPSGFRAQSGAFLSIGEGSNFWSTAALNTISAWYQVLSYNTGNTVWLSHAKGNALSVRCVKD